MKKLLIIGGILALLAVGAILVLNNRSVSDNLYEISLTQINKNIQTGAVVIDVRTPQEYETEHANNAINLPLDEIQNGKLPEVAKESFVYLYCRSGNRASQAKALLEQAGFEKVINIGGLNQWIVIGGQTSKNCPASSC
jgi:phage shock protein E